MSDERWWHLAACKGQDVNMFFAPNEAGRTPTRGKMFCLSCPVQLECLEDAMQREPDIDGKRHGIRGNMTPSERSRLAAGMPPLRVVS